MHGQVLPGDIIGEMLFDHPRAQRHRAQELQHARGYGLTDPGSTPGTSV